MSGRNRRRRLRCAAIGILAWPLGAGAQARTSVTFGPLISIQPAGYENASPYLDHGVAGTEPGLALDLQHRTPAGLVLALELSASKEMSLSQSGRLVSPEAGVPCGPFSGSGCGPAVARHSDTLASALLGKRFAWGRGSVEVKGGPSVIFGKARQGLVTYDDAAGHFALTAGVDGAIPLSDRAELVPSLRYSRAFRGETDFYVGLGANIFRIGIGLRLSLSGR